jgi:hypothetical protein
LRMAMKDKIKFGPMLDSGGRLAVRRRGDKVEECLLSPSIDGKPLLDGAELVRIEEPCDNGWHDAQTLYRHATSSGPPQVATRAYCEGYERIFGTKKIGLA